MQVAHAMARTDDVDGQSWWGGRGMMVTGHGCKAEGQEGGASVSQDVVEPRSQNRDASGVSRSTVIAGDEEQHTKEDEPY
jgi:hypothetical protein